MADGHICLSLDELDLKEESIDLPPGIQFENPIDTSVFGRHLKLVSDGNGEMTPFIFDFNSNKFYLHRNYFYEKNIVKHFKRISHITTDELKSRKEKLLELKPFIQNAAAQYLKRVRGINLIITCLELTGAYIFLRTAGFPQQKKYINITLIQKRRLTH